MTRRWRSWRRRSRPHENCHRRTANLSAGEYNASARKALQRDGYTIVASVGDQVSDMSYGHLKRGFLMPNTMYYLH